jgi:hypothetical protein
VLVGAVIILDLFVVGGFSLRNNRKILLLRIDSNLLRIDSDSLRLDANLLRIDANSLRIDSNSLRLDANSLRIDAGNRQINIDQCVIGRQLVWLPIDFCVGNLSK